MSYVLGNSSLGETFRCRNVFSELAMAPTKASYRVQREGQRWAINHDGILEGDYETKEAAFEAIIGAASNSIKDGFSILIEIPGAVAGESALGAD